MHRIAIIPGDGIGTEVINGALAVINRLRDQDGLQIDYEILDYGSARYKKTGTYAPDGFLQHLKAYDAILFGAVGDPDIPDSISLWELLLPMRQAFQQYVNLRPVKALEGIAVPCPAAKDIDWVIVRENTEGEYAGQGGRTHRGTSIEVANEVAVFTRAGCERVLRYAFETADKRDRKRLTVVTKSNAQRYGLVLWDEVAEIVSKDFPNVKWDKMLVDAMTVRMVRQPASLDTIVCTNLHGDILSDLAAALAGSIGIAASCNLNPDKEFPSMFEPVHGAAFDIMGKNIANPVAALFSTVHLLEHLGEHASANKLERALYQTIAQGKSTRDIGGQLGTAEAAQAVMDNL